ncbi:hydroxycarboxylic acid receptor 2 [Electrophorus electricus]|nr:hydroxycarboxylic acid receptor 2 [Electrophorus electricus]
MQSNDSHHCGQVPQTLVATFLPPILIIELLLGLPGNLMALYVFCRHFQCWRPTILFLFNLVLADFLLLVSLPFRIDNLLRGENWVFGDAWCRINLFMLAVNRSGSIAFMTAVALDRYFKVVHPHHKVNSMNSHQAAGVAFFIWTVVSALRLPLLTNNLLSMVENNGTNISICRSFSSYKNPSVGIKLHYNVYIAEFFLPLLLLLFCSFRISCVLRRRHMDKEKKVRRAIRTVLVIVGVFIICFFPGIATGLTAMYLTKMGKEYCNGYILNSQLFSLSIGFTYLNSALDPVIYLFSSSMFRNTVRKAINRTGLVQLNLSRRGSTTSGSDF